jgi:hypothetical protein
LINKPFTRKPNKGNPGIKTVAVRSKASFILPL